jgi:hypothetical protein
MEIEFIKLEVEILHLKWLCESFRNGRKLIPSHWAKTVDSKDQCALSFPYLLLLSKITNCSFWWAEG